MDVMTPAGRLLLLGATALVYAASGKSWPESSSSSSAALYHDCRLYDNATWFGGQVCGSDGITYPNSRYLHCLNYQQPDRRVSVRHGGVCGWTRRPCPYSPYYVPVCASDGRTYANSEALACRSLLGSPGQEVHMRHSGECYRQRPCRWAGKGGTPVCASNGFTYPGLEDVACLRSMDAGVHVLHEGGCSLEEVRGLVGSQYHACLVVRTHAEWNPVCAPGGTTYPSPILMFCHRPELFSWLPGECGSALHTHCKRAAFDRGCAPGAPLRPVCGTDGETYPSVEDLLCASRCSKYVQVKHSGRCQPQDDPCRRDGELADSGTPVCGTDGVSYVTPEALWCSRRMHKPHLSYLHDGPCLANVGRFH